MKFDSLTIYLLGMVAVIVAVTVFAYWDQQTSKKR